MFFYPTFSGTRSAHSGLRRIAVTLLASAAIATAGVTTDALAFGRGGGGGGFHGGGGGFHGGGGGFHMGGGGFHMGGGGAFHGYAARGIGGRSFAGHSFAPHGFAHMGGGAALHGFAARGIGGRGLAGRSLGAHGLAAHGGHAFAGRTLNAHGGRTFVAHGNMGPAAVHNGSGAHTFATRGVGNAQNAFAHTQFAHNMFAHNQLAHNQFVAQNFHGLYNFNHTGFNRNAFGAGRNWNRWGGQFWGAGWNNWGWGWGGWAGPVFWPFLYGDVFSFAFWPDDYYDPFWAYGPDFLLASIFAPGPYFGADYGYAPDYYYYGGYAAGTNIYYGGYSGPAAVAGGVSNADRQALAETNAAAAESCSGLAPGVADLPIAEIKQTIRPTGDQVTALDELSTAAAKASDVVKASCSTAIPLTPVARLDAAEARLEAMIQGVGIVSQPLERFYDSLSSEQKDRFDAVGNAGNGRAESGGSIAALCSQQSGGVTNLPVQRIEQVVQPNGQQQQDMFDALKQASRDAAQQLQSSCPTQVPQTPVTRLEAAKTRLQSMVEAMNTIRPKLQAFYASLSDEQKARFNTMGPPQNQSAQRQGTNR